MSDSRRRALASALLICAGFGLSLVVRAGLGRSFSVVPEARRLVTSDSYALCRHPLYPVEPAACWASACSTPSLGRAS